MTSSLLVSLVLAAALQAAPPVAIDDPALRDAVHRYFETQQQEDVAGYLALWSADARRPSAEQLRYVFDSGDDRFSGITVVRAAVGGGRARVRIEAHRERTMQDRPPPQPPMTIATTLRVTLAFAREGGDWRLVREGPPADDLAAEIMDARSPEEREALLSGEPDLIGPQIFAAFARLGGAASAAQDHARALAVYEQLVRVASSSGYRKEEGEGLQNVANTLYFLRRFPEALAAYERRLAIERARHDEAGAAAALGGIATINYSSADYTDALARYREALAIHERLDDVAGIASTSLSIGNIAYLQGDFAAAVAAYRRSLELHRTMFHADGESRALEGLGRVHMAQGDYLAALDAFGQVLADRRLAGAPGRLGSAAQNAGDVHLKLGNLDAARSRYLESRLKFAAAGDMGNAGRALQGLALTELMANRLRLAEELYGESGAICDAADDPACGASALSGLAYVQAAQDKHWDAVATYRRAVTAFESLNRPDEAARCEVGLSEALADAGDTAAAVAAAIRARHTALARENDDVMWRALTAEARAVRQLGDRTRALGIAGAAAAVVDRMAASALDRPGSAVTRDAVAALATLAVLQAESGAAAEAFRTAERLHALERRAALAVNEREIARGLTAEQRDHERALAADLVTRLAQQSREKGLPKPDPDRLARLAGAVDTATAARRTWLQSIFAAHPEVKRWRGLEPPPDIVSAATLLMDAGDVLLSFVVDEDDLLTLMVTRQEGAGGPLPALQVTSHLTRVRRRQLADVVSDLHRAVVLDDGVRRVKAVAQLTAALPPAVLADIASASNLIVVPHDVLWRVPFEVLQPAPRQGVRAPTIVTGASLASLGSRPRPRGDLPPGRVLAVAAPELPGARLDHMRQAMPDWQPRSPESASLEAGSVAERYGADASAVLAGPEATEEAVRHAFSRVSVLHVAAPFRVNAASPLFSAIVLTAPAASPARTLEPAAGGEAPAHRLEASNDGLLEVREVANLDAAAGLVVLSDGEATSMRDGATSAHVVHWGWMAAGVPAMLLARWAAPPSSMERLLGEFHRRLRDGASLPAALRDAQDVLRRDPATAAPVHWAGWMLLSGGARAPGG